MPGTTVSDAKCERQFVWGKYYFVCVALLNVKYRRTLKILKKKKMLLVSR